MKLDLTNPLVIEVLKAWGTPYVWGAGQPSDGTKENWYQGVKSVYGGIGYDCSGFVGAALVVCKLIKPDHPDTTAQGFFNQCNQIKIEEAKFGDLCFYGKNSKNITHITFYLGNEVIIGANGGTSKTKGNDPKAYIKLDHYRYRTDFIGIGRLK